MVGEDDSDESQRGRSFARCKNPWKTRVNEIIGDWIDGKLSTEEAQSRVFRLRSQILSADDAIVITTSSRDALRNKIEDTAVALNDLRSAIMTLAQSELYEVDGHDERDRLAQRSFAFVHGRQPPSSPSRN